MTYRVLKDLQAKITALNQLYNYSVVSNSKCVLRLVNTQLSSKQPLIIPIEHLVPDWFGHPKCSTLGRKISLLCTIAISLAFSVWKLDAKYPAITGLPLHTFGVFVLHLYYICPTFGVTHGRVFHQISKNCEVG